MAGLTDDQLVAIKAKICLEELNEKETEREGQVQYIKEWITKHPWIKCRTDDAFILRFLRVSKYILPTAQRRIENFCTVRGSELDGEPQWFINDITNEKVMDCIRKNWMYKLPGLDDNGRIVVMTKFGNIKPKKMDVNVVLQASCIFFDWVLMQEESQIGGIVLIEDTAGISMEHMTYFPQDLIKRSMKIWQDVSPMRLKELHYINLPKFLNAVMEVMKVFMSKKHQDRMKIHWKQDDVFKKIPRRMLPKEYGGNAGTINELCAETISGMQKSVAEYELLSTCGVDESKRPKEEPVGDSWGMVGSFRKLNTD